MSKHLPLLKIYLWTFIVLLHLCFQSPLKAGEVTYPTVEKGKLNLSQWDFETQGFIKVKGEWEFYWKQLLTPFDFKSLQKPEVTKYIEAYTHWKKIELDGTRLPLMGYATYRLNIVVNDPNETYAIDLGKMPYAFDVWVNQQKIASYGTIGQNLESHVGVFTSPLIKIVPEDGKIELIVQVSNFSYINGGLANGIKFGTEKQLTRTKQYSLVVVLLILGSIAIMAFYHLCIFLMRPKEKGSLIFGILGVLFAINIFLFDETIDIAFTIFNNYDFQFKAIVLSLFGSAPLLCLLMKELYPKEINLRLERTIITVYGVLALFVLFLKPVNQFYLITGASLFTVFVCYYLLSVLTKAISNKREGSLLLFIGITALIISWVNDSLYVHGIITTKVLRSFGFIILTLIQAWVLSKRFSKAFGVMELMADELNIKNEELIEKNTKLLNVDRTKNEFLEQTTAYLHYPLRRIVGLAEIILGKSHTSFSDSEQSNLKMLVASSKRLSLLVSNVLDFTRSKHSHLQLKLATFGLKGLVANAIDLSIVDLNNKPVRFVNDISDALPLVYGDKERTLQILHSLIENATKYTDQGEIKITAEATTDMVQVTVLDTGIGIEEEYHQQIFKEYEQLREWDENHNQGIGLGLSIVKLLVEKQGGKIWMNSEVDSGSRFTFSIPISLSELNGQETKRSNQSLPLDNPPDLVELAEQSLEICRRETGVVQIWIVDDDPVNQQIVQGFLASAQAVITCFYEGTEALNLIEKGSKPDLILLDIVMPNVSGFEVCQKIRKKYSMAELPIIFITGRNGISDLVQGFSVGANDYLVKPFLKDELTSRVYNQLQQYAINRNLVQLKDFSTKITKLKDFRSILIETFNTLHSCALPCGLSMFHDGKPIKSLSLEPTGCPFMIAPPDNVAIANESVGGFSFFMENKIGNDHPLAQHNLNLYEIDIEGYSILYIKLEELENTSIILYRLPDQPEFSRFDMDIVVSVFDTLKATRSNLRQLFSNASAMESVSIINQHLSEILYIKSSPPNVTLFLDNSAISSQKEISFNMQDIPYYFDESNLIRIHHSYFVNPKKLVKVRKKSVSDYEAVLNTESLQTITLNIERNYLPQVRNLHSTHFSG